MKKLFLSFCLFTLMAPFIFAETKMVVVDNLYKIQFDYDSASKALELKLFSENSAAFDEQYAADIIEDELNAFLHERNLSDAELTDSSKDTDFEGRYTVVKNNYKLD